MGAAAGAAIGFGCGGASPTSPDTASSTTTTTGSTNAACAVTPSETAGPYPSLVDLFRSDIRDGRSGTLLTLTVKVVNVNSACAAVPSADVEVWHCDSAGNYSEYGTQTTQNYLRGIQTANAPARSHLPRSIRAGIRGGPPTSTWKSRPTASPGRRRRLRFPRASTTPFTELVSMRRGDRIRRRIFQTGSSPTVCRPNSSRHRAIQRPATPPAARSRSPFRSYGREP